MRHELPQTVALHRETRAFALRFALLALLIAQLSLFVHPTGFEGGPSDDQRYLDIALDWWANGPSAGTTHWALRAPLIAALNGAFAIAGTTLAAIQIVPRFFYGIFVLATAGAMARWGGRRAAWVWLALVVTSPVLHGMATACYPEIVELAMGALSLTAFLAARREDDRIRLHGWMILSGLALGIGAVTRETIVFLAVGYAWTALRKPHVPRAAYVTLFAAMALPVLADIIWLWSQTGDPLYRLHVDQNHTRIFSAHLRGGVYEGGSPFFNVDLAKRWIPAGPTNLFWPLNPLGDFLIDPAFGFVLIGCALVALPAFRRKQSLSLPRGALPMLILLALGCYLTVTWVFSLRPQPRYYLPVIGAAQIGFAFAIATMLARKTVRRRATILLALVLLGGTIPILVQRPKGQVEQRAVDYIATHPGLYAAEVKTAGRMAFRAQLAGVAPPLVGDPPVGGYRISRISSSIVKRAGGRMPVEPGYRDVDLLMLDEPAIVALVRPGFWHAVRVEQRVR